jgi:hypothetical protein
MFCRSGPNSTEVECLCTVFIRAYIAILLLQKVAKQTAEKPLILTVLTTLWKQE